MIFVAVSSHVGFGDFRGGHWTVSSVCFRVSRRRTPMLRRGWRRRRGCHRRTPIRPPGGGLKSGRRDSGCGFTLPNKCQERSIAGDSSVYFFQVAGLFFAAERKLLFLNIFWNQPSRLGHFFFFPAGGTSDSSHHAGLDRFGQRRCHAS